MTGAGGRLTHEILQAATARPSLLAALRPPIGPVALPSPLPVAELAVAAVAAASLAAASLAHVRREGRVPDPGELTPIALDGARVSAAYRSEQVFRLNGEKPDAWAAASGFFEAADGWVRTHGNYPHHASALRRMLKLPDGAGRDQIAAALREGSAAHWEDDAAARGAIVGRVRTEAEWRAHPHALAVRGQPLVRRRTHESSASALPGAPRLPLEGIRVLDLTRVIAGPVATRTLALFGAEVLRVDSPQLPEIGWQYLDTGQGKRSVLLDLSDAASRVTLDELLARADVLVTGYRPGALTRFGLDPASLREDRPHLITTTVDAWGPEGPWSRRRGFDSIVQAVSGIAELHGTDAGPGALPAQALDHTTGYLLAATVMNALEARHLTGAVTQLGVSLARVAQSLLDAPRTRPPVTASASASDEWRDRTVELPAPAGGSIRCAQPAPVLDGLPMAYPPRPLAYGASSPEW